MEAPPLSPMSISSLFVIILWVTTAQYFLYAIWSAHLFPLASNDGSTGNNIQLNLFFCTLFQVYHSIHLFFMMAHFGDGYEESSITGRHSHRSNNTSPVLFSLGIFHVIYQICQVITIGWLTAIAHLLWVVNSHVKSLVVLILAVIPIYIISGSLVYYWKKKHDEEDGHHYHNRQIIPRPINK